MDQEIERFKMQINLSEFSASRGYFLDRRESSKNSAVMRHPNGDKIVVAKLERTQTGKPPAWYFFSIRDDRDHGSIIDFLQNRDITNLGEIRKALRAWLGSPRPVIKPTLFVPDLVPVSRDRAAVLAEWERAKPCASLPYLTSRGLGPDVLALPRFAGCFRVDQRNNALFPHYDHSGLSGYEIKNKGFTGFAPGGLKGLWHSKTKPSDHWLVFTESAIDAYSFQIIHGGDGSRYMSTGGALNTQQPALLRGAMEKMPDGSVIILAFDRDAGGDKLTAEVEALVPAGRKVRRMLPEPGTGKDKDWNDMLKQRLGLG